MESRQTDRQTDGVRSPKLRLPSLSLVVKRGRGTAGLRAEEKERNGLERGDRKRGENGGNVAVGWRGFSGTMKLLIILKLLCL